MKYKLPLLLGSWLLCLTIGYLFAGWRERTDQFVNIGSDGASVLKMQEQAWNEGNLAGFLSGYEMNEDITFFSDDRVMKGWVAVNDRYHARYGQPGRMGKLAFSELQISPFSSDYAMVRGRWTVTDSENAGTGLFTVIIRKTENGYKVVHDHTSAKKPENK